MAFINVRLLANWLGFLLITTLPTCFINVIILVLKLVYLNCDIDCTLLGQNEPDNDFDQSCPFSESNLICVQCIFTNELTNMNYLFTID